MQNILLSHWLHDVQTHALAAGLSLTRCCPAMTPARVRSGLQLTNLAVLAHIAFQAVCSFTPRSGNGNMITNSAEAVFAFAPDGKIAVHTGEARGTECLCTRVS